MGHFNQYKETPQLRNPNQVTTEQETDQIGRQLINPAPLNDLNDSVQAFHDDYNVTNVTTDTTTTIKAEAGRIGSIRVLGGTLGNVTVYDNTAGSGTVLVPTFTPDKGQILLQNCKFNVGLTIVTAAATIVSVKWR